MLTLVEKNFSQLDSESESEIFWKSLQEALKANKKGVDGKIRILSIIADNFTYRKLKEKLGVSYKLYFIDLYNKFYKKKILQVGSDIINSARKHAKLYGPGAPSIIKPKRTVKRMSEIKEKQFLMFFQDRSIVIQSSY